MSKLNSEEAKTLIKFVEGVKKDNSEDPELIQLTDEAKRFIEEDQKKKLFVTEDLNKLDSIIRFISNSNNDEETKKLIEDARKLIDERRRELEGNKQSEWILPNLVYRIWEYIKSFV